MKSHKTLFLLLCLLAQLRLYAQPAAVPNRQEGEGPWPQLIIRGVILINSTGSPPLGPVDIVVENNRITDVRVVGTTALPIDATKRPPLKPGGKELDASGMYLLPGFVDTHAHIGNNNGSDASYVYKLWMAHGVTTIREPSAGNGLAWTLEQKKKSAQNTITAPRIRAYTRFGMGSKQPIATPQQAREWVRQNAKAGADGIKFFGAAPEIMQAAAEENKKLGLKSAIHHSQTDVGRWNAMHSAKAGISSLEHWYGLPEAMFTDRTVQHYSLDYNYTNEQDRFEDAGTLWNQTAAPFSAKWNKVMNELIALNFTLCPTFNIYEANRDLMRARTAEWHMDYTMPELWKFYTPSWNAHGSYWHSWGTEQEVQWRENFRLWMAFINEYKNRGGRVTVGTDSGFIYELFGFAYPREMELLREAGFHPLEVIKAATLNGAELLGMEKEIGSVEIGKLADFVIVEENPLKDFKVLYGTGAIRLAENNQVSRVGGVKYTIKDGIIYDAKDLLAQVKKMVEAEKAKTGFQITQPGVAPHKH
ncbi:amidohydrolase [Hymenobacter roseosalivarius DSM 11622]|uniref:Amidohydrolase n=1 Tax=Hymenobacter roseosalivarius DSM 11622 TaxID=645990 RepID=A0A1W1UGZ1_9BACT|nr:amidohydrolase family protein [Hymenobacter roseosalivarius]SMB80340.1 amidohydrolase [Hymenobacter roseosalivarius DSM 11622]